ncbi:MAG: SIR2 family protein [Oscillospiraceae bacterium]
MISSELFKSIFSGKAVLFLGAGASKSSNGPIGTELADYLSQELGIEGDTSDLSIFSQSVLKKCQSTRKEIEDCISRRLKNLEPSQGYLDMAHLPWKSIYSVNYDNLVEQAYKNSKSRYELKIINKNNLFEEKDNDQIKFFKLHGSITDVYSEFKPLILTYDDLISKESFRSDMLKILTASLHDTIIFIGYSFSDGVIEDILKEFKNSHNYESIKQKYLVAPSPSKRDIQKFETLYECISIDMQADDFFKQIRNKFESNYKAQLESFGKSLSIFNGENQVNFPASVKSAIEYNFDYYEDGKTYPNDANYFYRCGTPSWGNITNHLDVNRNISLTVDDHTEKLNSDEIPELIYDNLTTSTTKIYKITGPIAVGKSTLCYKIAYELHQKGVLSLFTNSTESVRKNLLVEIYDNFKKPFIIFIDDAINYVSKISQLLNECTINNIPVTFILAVRENDWEWLLDKQLKNRLSKDIITIRVEDDLSNQQSKELADKLIKNMVFIETPEFTQKDLIVEFSKTKNLVASLMNSIDKTDFQKKIIQDFDRLSPKTQNAYAMISLVNRLCLPFKWELLQRSLESRYSITWEDFINSVVRIEAKDSVIEGGSEENLFYTCRHNYIAMLISNIFYNQNTDAEIEEYKVIIRSVNKMTIEEIFIGKMLKYIVDHKEELRYSHKQVVELFNCALLAFSSPYYLLHIKGEYLMEGGKDYDEAIKCFDKCIRDNDNREYALHSCAKAHFHISLQPNIGDRLSQFEFNNAISLLKEGTNLYPQNNFYYKFYFQIVFGQLQKVFCSTLVDEANGIYTKYKNNSTSELEIESLYIQINKIDTAERCAI